MARKRLTLEQRKALRQWYFSQNPRPSQRVCCSWFFDTFKHKISQSTVSESLNDHFRFVDQPASTTLARQSTAQWPILESILAEWEQKVTANGNVVSGEILIEKARSVWPQIPQYQHLPQPEFSQGWLSRFKARYDIRKRKRHGEAASIPPIAAEQMKSIRTICGEYAENDIYNMDETGLYWRRALSEGLSSQSVSGVKKQKSRISVVVCTNCTGSDRLPLWFIGHAKTPRALRGINVTALGAIWKSNKKAWMTTAIMVPWLEAFYQHVGSRDVILTMDNFSAHIAGVEEAPPPSNVRIIWLPANSTSHFQPLDQGIIQNFKVYYRKQWLAFIINQFEHEIDPYSTITVYHAIRWCIRAWQYDVTNPVIYNCFRKSTIIEPTIQNLPQSPEPDLSTLYQQAQQAARIQDAMSLSHFLNPEDENDFVPPVTLEDIVQQHVQLDEDEEALLEDVEPLLRRVPTKDEALLAIHTLFQFQEHQEETRNEDIRYLERLEKAIQRRRLESQQQSTLDQWIT